MPLWLYTSSGAKVFDCPGAGVIGRFESPKVDARNQSTQELLVTYPSLQPPMCLYSLFSVTYTMAYRGQLAGTSSLLPTWILGIELRLSKLQGRNFKGLSHLAEPGYLFWIKRNYKNITEQKSIHLKILHGSQSHVWCLCHCASISNKLKF